MLRSARASSSGPATIALGRALASPAADRRDGGDLVVTRDLDQVAWHRVLEGFDDAHLHQTQAFASGKWGAGRLSNLVVAQDGEALAATQVVTLGVLGTRWGVAHVRAGPLWRPRRRPPELAAYRRILQALREVYVERRGLVLRLAPRQLEPEIDGLARVLQSEGFVAHRGTNANHTWAVDLTPPLAELRANLKRNWRYVLSKAEQRSLACEVTTDATGLEEFLALHGEMRARKRYLDLSPIDSIRSIQDGLPRSMKLETVLCRERGRPVAGSLMSTLGRRTAVAVFGATSLRGREIGASHFLDWWVVAWLKARGFAWYDLGGGAKGMLVPYKSGLVGKNSTPIDFLAEHQLSGHPLSTTLVILAERLRDAYRRTRG